jgi:hypothetical protein
MESHKMDVVDWGDVRMSLTENTMQLAVFQDPVLE